MTLIAAEKECRATAWVDLGAGMWSKEQFEAMWEPLDRRALSL
jgi:hypothetical protein